MDHKAVLLLLSIEKTKSKIYINPSVFSFPRTDDVVWAATADCYLNHAVPDQQMPGDGLVHHGRQRDRIGEEKAKVGNLFRLITEYNSIAEQIARNGENNRLELELAAKNTEIRIQRDSMWDIQVLTNLILVPSDEFFLESLLSSVKGHLIAYQTWYKKTEHAQRNILVKTLNELKVNYEENANEIYTLESRLNELVQKNVLAKAKTMKIFECLNAEKPTPMFLNLAKKTKTNQKLENVKKPDGTPFTCNKDRENYIVDYYSSLYKKPDGERLDYDGCIDEFLGQDICSHRLVLNSKLTETEKIELDLPLTIDEIDKSLEKANMRSAPGIDGISNVLLSRYWPYFRIGIYKYALRCFETGRLTDTFRGATVKLIPKKGDLTQLKNWRPISLLSNVYKILSRALNNRLNKVVNRICSRAQKGFNDSRYTQEVLINVIETIAYCNTNNVGGGVIAVDMAKAFDTLSHGFMNEVFRFLNFGPNLIRWLKLYGENRTACIILDNSEYSKSFPLERSRAQGDNISPNTFNFADQILIWKIELDPMIAGVWQNFQIPQEINLNDTSFFACESNRETGKNESMADDNTTLALMTTDNLARLRAILDDFGDISGLRCNYDKTCILKVGPVPEVPIDLHGFVCTDSITLLGMEVKNVLSNQDEIFLGIREKILSIVRFWDLFRLSLPGRISVIKTLILPQLNYLGCILKPSTPVLEELQSICDNFALKGLRVAENRLYLPANLGGLGLMHLGTYLDAQRIVWIVRAAKKNIDNWRVDLKNLSPDGDVSRIRKTDVGTVRHPILHNIVTSFEKLVESHAKINGNYKIAYIFENRAFTWGGDNRLLDKVFFGADFYNRHKARIRNLRFADCYSNGNFKTLRQFVEMGLPLSMNTWLLLRGALSKAKNNYRKEDPLLEAKEESLLAFLTKQKKGSKKIRKVLDSETINQSQPNTLRIVESFARITLTAVPNTNVLKNVLSVWNFFCFSNDFREFLFKQRNNTLGVGARVAHFDDNVDERCTFCRLLYPGTNTREDFIHIFRTCPITVGLIQNLIRRLRLTVPIPGPNPDPYFDNLYWYGTDGNESSLACLIFFDLFRYCLWKFKTRRKLPRILELTDILLSMLGTILAVKPKLRITFFNTRLIANVLQALG
jgi:hypothetical protein